MRVPAPREPRHGLWETIRYAIENNPRTFRFCLTVIVLSAAAVVVPGMLLYMLLSQVLYAS